MNNKILISLIVAVFFLGNFVYAEPDMSGNTITWKLVDDTGYTFSNCELEDDTDGGGVLSRIAGDTTDDLDDNSFTEWYDATSLTQDTSTKRFGTSSAAADGGAEDFSSLALESGVWAVCQDVVYFYWPGGAISAGNDAKVFWTSNGAKAPFAVITGFGVDGDVSTSNFVYYNTATGSWTDTSIVASQGWYRIAQSSSSATGTMQLYMNTTQLMSYSQAYRPLGIAVHTTDLSCNIDRIWHRRGNLLQSSGTIATPKAQPIAVTQWTGFTTTQTTNGGEYKGTVTYEASYSTDGGTNWGTNSPNYNDSNWETLSSANLQAVVCGGDGNDAVKVRASLTMDTIWTPIVDDMQITYTGTGTEVKNAVINNAVVQ